MSHFKRHASQYGKSEFSRSTVALAPFSKWGSTANKFKPRRPDFSATKSVTCDKKIPLEILIVTDSPAAGYGIERSHVLPVGLPHTQEKHQHWWAVSGKNALYAAPMLVC